MIRASSKFGFKLPAVKLSASSIRRLSSESRGKERISLALYRQLLRWCNGTEDDIPLSYFIPPIHMSPPQVDATRLRSLSEEQKAMFPRKSIIEETQITCPIGTSEDAKLFLRSVFRLNKYPSENEEDQKRRITMAFEGMRSLNELSQALSNLKRNRASHVLRDGVKFRVGQVVKHKVEDWRAVITGWQRIGHETSDDTGQATSLTQMTYKLGPEDSIKYTVVLDSGDAHLNYSKRQEARNLSVAEVHQSDLDCIEDESLVRIRSTHASEYFKGFDSRSKMFIPNDIVTYEYPNDVLSDIESHGTSNSASSEVVATSVIEGIQDATKHLQRIILDYTSAPESRQLKILTLFLDRLAKITDEEVVPMKDRFSDLGLSKDKVAPFYLERLVGMAEDIGDLLWQRRRSLECESVRYSVGDIVRHKVYGFRGVVVAWDPEPTVDVSRWDGLQHIESPDQYPFYHIIPDQNDCVQAFGAERPSRYVCEENLEPCPPEEQILKVDLEPGWELKSSEGVYVPPQDLMFKYGGSLEDEGLTKQCLVELRDALTKLFVAMRDSTSSGNQELDAAAEKMSAEKLMQMLKHADDMGTATVISDSLKEVWRAHMNGDMRDRLDTAIGALLGGKTERALGLFTGLIDDDPTYAEAWNKASTCQFMLGNMEASLVSAQKTLDILPNHFQAQNGLGLVYYEKKDLPAAVESFRKSIQIDPWSPVSARLSVCLDTLEQWQKTQRNEPKK